MIATAFYDGQGLGNQLWVYAACRSIAEKLHLPHIILNPDKFKGSSFLDVDFGLKNTPDTDNTAKKMPLAVFHERIFYDQDLDYFSSDFDDTVLNLKPFTKIDGLFQSEDYFFGDSERLKRYVKIKPHYLQKQLVSDDCCIVYIRGGEYKRHKNLILPKSYWQNAMRNMRDLFGIDSFIAVSDDDRYVGAMFSNLPLIQGGMAEDYVALYQAKFAIIANSSWGYFPVKTGVDKTCVIAPKHWSRFGNKYSRWASPANFYKGWMWQDAAGSLHSYTDCLQEVENTKKYYHDNYYLSTVPSAVVKYSIKTFLPIWFKKPIKKGLSLILPRRIG